MKKNIDCNFCGKVTPSFLEIKQTQLDADGNVSIKNQPDKEIDENLKKLFPKVNSEGEHDVTEISNSELFGDNSMDMKHSQKQHELFNLALSKNIFNGLKEDEENNTIFANCIKTSCFFIISQTLNIIVNIQPLKPVTRVSIAKATKAFESAQKKLEESLSFREENQWQFVKVMYCHELSESEKVTCCESCKNFVFDSNENFGESWQKMKEALLDSKFDSDFETYKMAVKLILYTMFILPNMKFIEKNEQTNFQKMDISQLPTTSSEDLAILQVEDKNVKMSSIHNETYLEKIRSRNPSPQILLLNGEASYSHAVDRVAMTIKREAKRCIIIVDNHNESFVLKFKCTFIGEKVLIWDTQENIKTFSASADNILVITAQSQISLQELEVNLIVVFTDFSVDQKHWDFISSCKSNLVIVCKQEHLDKIRPAKTNFGSIEYIYGFEISPDFPKYDQNLKRDPQEILQESGKIAREENQPFVSIQKPSDVKEFENTHSQTPDLSKDDQDPSPIKTTVPYSENLIELETKPSTQKPSRSEMIIIIELENIALEEKQPLSPSVSSKISNNITDKMEETHCLIPKPLSNWKKTKAKGCKDETDDANIMPQTLKLIVKGHSMKLCTILIVMIVVLVIGISIGLLWGPNQYNYETVFGIRDCKGDNFGKIIYTNTTNGKPHFQQLKYFYVNKLDSGAKMSLSAVQQKCQELNATLWDVRLEAEWESMLKELHAKSFSLDIWLNGRVDGDNCQSGKECLKEKAKSGKGLPVIWKTDNQASIYSRLYRGETSEKKCIYVEEGKPNLWSTCYCELEEHFGICIKRDCSLE